MTKSASDAQHKWLLVREIFDEIVDLPDPERISFLDSRTSDPFVQAEIVRMLASWTRAQTWFDRMGRSVAQLAARPAFEPGEILADRYRINRLIARGGMGEVYEAADSVLSGLVALKTLRPSLALQPSVHATFRKEILLSRTIKSPCICRVHDIEDHQYPGGEKITFYTMELLAGESLATCIRKKGRFTLKEIRPIVRGIATGLDAAHRLGILHRDFKPGNVMLTPAGPVITDFGLAFQMAEGAEAFNAATPDYASPEQLEGSEQTAATDIYSLGVVIFEMLTGHLPTGQDRLSAKVPKIVRQCLALGPDDRPASALLVAERLGALDSPPGLSRRMLWFAPASALVAAAGYRFTRSSGQVLPRGARVLLAPSGAVNADSESSGTLAILLSQQLSQSGALDLAGTDEVRGAMARIGKPFPAVLTLEEWRQVALRAGTTALVLASQGYDPASYKSSLNLVLEVLGDSTRTPLTVEKRSFAFSGDFTGSAAGNAPLSAAVQEAAIWIRETAGESRNTILSSTLPINEITTHSWEALKEFVAAETSLDTELKLAHLHSATDRDPDFALAWTRLGDLYYANSRDAEGQAAYHKAMSTATSHLAPREEFRIRSFIANDQWDYPEADRQFRLWSARFPSDPNASLWRISSLIALKRGAESVDVYSALVHKQAENTQALQFLAVSFLLTGQFDRMSVPLNRLRNLKMPDLADRWNSARLFLQGRVSQAQDLLNGLFGRSNPVMRLRVAFWILWYLCHSPDPAPALRRADEFLSLPVPSGAEGFAADLHLGIASLFAVAGRPVSTVVNILETAIAWGAGPNHAFRAGVIFARAGELAASRRILEKYFPAPETVKERLWSIRLRGHIELAMNNTQAAVRLFDQARVVKTNRIEPEWGLILAYGKAGQIVMSRQARDELRAQPGFYLWWPAPELLGMRSVLL